MLNKEEIMGALIEVMQQGNIVEIAFNRPQFYNAFDLDTISELTNIITKLAADSSVKGIALTGRGKAFCSGGDLKWAVNYSEKPGVSFHTLASQFHKAILAIRKISVPVVAAINGPAAGGGFAIALACDFRIMEKSAVLTQAYTSNGLSIDGGGTYTLPRMVGFARALEIAAFDRPISAMQALDWGLVTRVVEDGKALAEAMDILNGLAKGSLHSFGWSKMLLNKSLYSGLESQLDLEVEGLCACANHADGREGLQAFIEKRKPVFKG
jgi:2-(1,2-epoxy-1,2-dihydrophenyl)acetyl-CoA isomerase